MSEDTLTPSPPDQAPLPSPFRDVDDVRRRLEAEHYVASDAVATTVFLAQQLAKPILIEGPSGVGKTELAKTLARCLDTELLRLQCYEGLDEAKALFEWDYAKQLLYAQLLREQLGQLGRGAGNLSEAVEELGRQQGAFFNDRFLLARPLLAALRAPKRVVLLIDEVDRGDPELEALLLEVLSDFQVSIPELGTLKAVTPPLVVLTSNRARELTDALRRRCLYLYLELPGEEAELAILRARLPHLDDGLRRGVVAAVAHVRALQLRRPPSTAEALEWARALSALAPDAGANLGGADGGSVQALIFQTLPALLKSHADGPQVERALPELARRLAGDNAIPSKPRP